MAGIIPVPMTKDGLLAVIDDIRDLVAADDSFEGNLNYLMPDPEDPPGTDFKVIANYRIGNSMGQGGMRIVGEMPSAENGR